MGRRFLPRLGFRLQPRRRHRFAGQALQTVTRHRFRGTGLGLLGQRQFQRALGLVEIGPGQVAGGDAANDVVAQAAGGQLAPLGQQRLVAGSLPGPPGIAHDLGETQAESQAAPGQCLGFGFGDGAGAAALAGQPHRQGQADLVFLGPQVAVEAVATRQQFQGRRRGGQGVGGGDACCRRLAALTERGGRRLPLPGLGKGAGERCLAACRQGQNELQGD